LIRGNGDQGDLDTGKRRRMSRQRTRYRIRLSTDDHDRSPNTGISHRPQLPDCQWLTVDLQQALAATVKPASPACGQQKASCCRRNKGRHFI
jgi:hypothetical protein